MHQVGVLFALSVQLDHIALQLNYPLMFLAVMEHMQIQKDRIHVANVQKDSSAQILLSRQSLVKMEPLASLALLSAPFVQQDTGKKVGVTSFSFCGASSNEGLLSCHEVQMKISILSYFAKGTRKMT